MENIWTPAVVAAVVAAVVTVGVGWAIEVWRKNNERYEKLYGPLKYKLIAMRALTKNSDTLIQELRNKDSNKTIADQSKHVTPLYRKWHEYKDETRELLGKYPGYIKKEDLDVFSNFIDACIKRDIAENDNFESALSAEDNRTGKIMAVITQMQERFLENNLEKNGA